jgi:hypothetical protein
MTWIEVIDTDVLIIRDGPVGIVTINRLQRRARSSRQTRLPRHLQCRRHRELSRCCH